MAESDAGSVMSRFLKTMGSAPQQPVFKWSNQTALDEIGTEVRQIEESCLEFIRTIRDPALRNECSTIISKCKECGTIHATITKIVDGARTEVEAARIEALLMHPVGSAARGGAGDGLREVKRAMADEMVPADINEGVYNAYTTMSKYLEDITIMFQAFAEKIGAL